MSWTPNMIDGLQLWLKADAIEGLNDNDLVQTWADSSGHDNDATQDTEGWRPYYKVNRINSLPALYCNSSRYMSTVDLSASFPTAATVFVLYQALTTHCAYCQNTHDGANADYFRYAGTGKAYLALFHTVPRIDEWYTAPSSGYHFLGIRSSASLYQAHLDGAAKSTQTPGYEAGSVHLIARGSTGLTHDADVAEVIVYSSALSDADIAKVEGYLAWKYDLVSLLPAEHVYKSDPPSVPAPTITSITPDSGTNDGPVDITDLAGTGFQEGAIARLTKAGQPFIAATAVNVVSATKITCTFDITGAALGLWNVWVQNPDTGNGLLPDCFTVDALPPAITSVVPASGKVGTAVTITGTSFGATQGGSTVVFENIDAGAATSWSDTVIVINVPGNAKSGMVVITVGGQASAGARFTVPTGKRRSKALLGG